MEPMANNCTGTTSTSIHVLPIRLVSFINRALGSDELAATELLNKGSIFLNGHVETRGTKFVFEGDIVAHGPNAIEAFDSSKHCRVWALNKPKQVGLRML